MITPAKEKIKEASSSFKKDFGLKNIYQSPRIEKICINVGFGRMISGKTGDEQRKIRESILQNLSLVAGQRAIFTRARKAVSAFKIRKGMIIGAKVTLRGDKMYDFLDRFLNIVLPRTRDFRGIPQESVDNKGNLTIGIKEIIVFPEILPENIKYNFGLEIVIHTTAKDKKSGLEFLRKVGVPFKK